MNGKSTYVFRVDASIDIGTGHVMRCLTLADALTERGACCYFVCRELLGNLIDFIRSRGYEVLPLVKPEAPAFVNEEGALPPHYRWLEVDWKTDAEQTLGVLSGTAKIDWLIVDHYALDYRWQQEVERVSERLFVIDDLADRKHLCDVLLDQNLGRRELDYDALIPLKSQTLIGPKYALLRPEFASYRNSSLQRRAQSSIERILVTLGGVDKNNFTSTVLAQLNKASLGHSCTIDVVMGEKSPWLKEVQEYAVSMKYETRVFVGVKNMAELMTNSDLAIGAAGSTSWERCCLGLPTLLLVLAANQEEIAKALHDNGAARSITLYELENNLSKIVESLGQQELREMAEKASTIVDAKGVERVLEKVA